MTTNTRTPAQAHSEAVLQAFSSVGVPLLDRYLQRFSCIEATRIAIECLNNFRVYAKPVATKFVVELPTLNVVYASGVSDEEIATARETARANLGENTWRGHLVAIVEDTWLLDPSFDEAFYSFNDMGKGPGFRVDRRGFLFELPERTDKYFDLQVSAIVQEGLPVNIRYIYFEDDSFRAAPAWTPDHVQSLIRHICRQMGARLRRGAE